MDFNGHATLLDVFMMVGITLNTGLLLLGNVLRRRQTRSLKREIHKGEEWEE